MSINMADSQVQDKNSNLRLLSQTIAVTVTPPLPKITHKSTVGDTKTFHKFGKLSLELQKKIFAMALPDSRIMTFSIDFIQIGKDPDKAWYDLYLQIPSFPGPLFLLETCKTSNTSVFHDGGFRKIEFVRPTSGAVVPFFSWRCPVHYKSLDQERRTHFYMRPSQDILMMDVVKLFRFYMIGGSINLKKLTHLILRGSIMQAIHCRFTIKLLIMIQRECPNLKRLSLLRPNKCNRSDTIGAISRYLDINETLYKLDFRYPSDTPLTWREFEIQRLRGHVAAAELTTRTIDRNLRIMEQEGNKYCIPFWKNVEVVPVLKCWSRNTDDESELWFPVLRAYIRRNDDGTLATKPERRRIIL
ncbi:hypothetical protein SBOR_9782 [Sclerotinia borealis F-4128]|uniref:2EXR domain-containing protein n=1 Tax=Sclerotinia borealis (strain F-4128) TaxID=1432307 RepID=W9C1T2_SCLBF|nr:hypothetical protein SBOR_9782 [Sclerotinia borealis F-4128]